MTGLARGLADLPRPSKLAFLVPLCPFFSSPGSSRTRAIDLVAPHLRPTVGFCSVALSLLTWLRVMKSRDLSNLVADPLPTQGNSLQIMKTFSRVRALVEQTRAPQGEEMVVGTKDSGHPLALPFFLITCKKVHFPASVTKNGHC